MRRNEAWFPTNTPQDVFIGLRWFVSGLFDEGRNCKPNCQVRIALRTKFGFHNFIAVLFDMEVTSPIRNFNTMT